MDLVQEQHVARSERGEDRDEISRAFDRRTAGHPQRDRQLPCDDHRQAGLAQPGWPGQQDVVGRTGAGPRPFQHDRKLLADLLLADELRQAPRPQTGLERLLLRLSHRRDQTLGIHGLHHRGRRAASVRRSSRATVSGA